LRAGAIAIASLPAISGVQQNHRIVMDARTRLDAIPIAIRREACAYHEAGHILVGWHHQRPISYAWLRPPHGVSGETCFQPYHKPFRREREQDRARAETEIVILHAGFCGEMIYWDQPGSRRWYPGELSSHHDDLEQMLAYISFIGAPDEAALRARCLRAATAILHVPKMLAAQRRIAAVLVANRRIESEDVAAIMRDCADTR
jgi:hypothetical protein